MNKTITVMAFTIFASSAAHMQAAFSYVEEVIATIQEIKSMNRTDCRHYSSNLSNISYKGPCTPGYTYRPQDSRDYLKDILRNEPEYGGSINALDNAQKEYEQSNVTSLYRNYYSTYYEKMVEFARFKKRYRGTGSLEEKLIDSAIAGKPQAEQIAHLTRYAAWGSQIASDKLKPLLPPTLTQLFTTPLAPAPKTVARSEKEEYEIALKLLEKSKELQDYAVILAQSRKA